MINSRASSVIRTLAPATALVFCLWINPARGDEYLTESKKTVLLESQRCLFNDEFNAAHDLIDSFIQNNSADPVGYIFKAAVCLGEMTDAESDWRAELFDSLINVADSLATAELDGSSARKDAWMHLFLGHATAYHALFESKFGSFASAIKLGLKVKTHYEQGLRIDSTLYDLYGGLGMYHYWKSAKAGILRWFGIFRNDKQRGIEELYLAIDSSSISSSVARNALIWIWLDRKEYDSAIAVCREMLQEFPDGKVFRWPLAKALIEKAQWHRALEVYKELRDKISPVPGNYYNLIECDYQLYQCYDKLGLANMADSVAERFSGYYDSIPGETKNRKRGEIAFLKRANKR